MTCMVEVERLVKRFGALTAVDGVTFDVHQGEVLGFLGPNGAGKSTTLRMITGFLPPSEGLVRVMGHDVVDEPISAKAAIGYLPEGAPTYPEMTPAAFLDFIANVRGLSGAHRQERLAYVIENLQLTRVLNQRIDTLSKGFKRRVMAAQAIVHDPPVLVLDEPTDGLDPNQKRELRRFITEMARNKAVIISTHDLVETEAICTRAIIIAQGTIRADASVNALAQQSPLHNTVVIETDAHDVVATLSAADTIADVESLADHVYRVYPNDGQDNLLEVVKDQARNQGWTVARLSFSPSELEETFRHLTSEQNG